MNFNDTLQSVELVLASGDVPLIVGESGIGKTALAKALSEQYDWELVVIDGNLLKEGEIGGLPTVATYECVDTRGRKTLKQTTVYAVHTKLRTLDEAVTEGKEVLLFIDEINRCEHAVQQELMNLILNREINGYVLPEAVKILAAMNPGSQHGEDFDYQVVEMDPAQENRFVWLHMESDPNQWLQWALQQGLDEKVIGFIATYPHYLNKKNEEAVHATPRSYERVSKSLKQYRMAEGKIPRHVFLNVLKGNVGKVISEALLAFLEADYKPILLFDEVVERCELSNEVILRIQEETHTRLYLIAINLLSELERRLAQGQGEGEVWTSRFINFLQAYPIDLMLGIMRDMKQGYPKVYAYALDNEAFVNAYFESYRRIRG